MGGALAAGLEESLEESLEEERKGGGGEGLGEETKAAPDRRAEHGLSLSFFNF